MLVSKIKAIRNGRVITKDFKTKDRNLVDINQERRRLEDKYEQALRDGDKGLAKIYSNRLEELRKEAIEAENKRDEERKNFGDSKTKDGEAEEAVIKAKLRANGDNAEAVKALMALGYSQADAFRTVKIWLENRDTVDPTKPKNIAAAKSLSVAQGKAATGDKKTKDEDKVGDWKNRVLGTMKKIYELQGEEDLYTLCNKAISQIRVPEVFRNEIYTDITGHWNASKNFILGR